VTGTVVVGLVQGGFTTGVVGVVGVVGVPGATPTFPTAKRETEAKRRAEVMNGVFMVKLIVHLGFSKKNTYFISLIRGKDDKVANCQD
jgi:hypothetical protein